MGAVQSWEPVVVRHKKLSQGTSSNPKQNEEAESRGNERRRSSTRLFARARNKVPGKSHASSLAGTS